MSSDDESGARYAVISKYAELLALVSKQLRATCDLARDHDHDRDYELTDRCSARCAPA
jgi:hypothetical protein